MRIVDLLRCGCTNFMLFKDPMEYEFPNGKLFVISGPNGSGKTSIFDIVPFATYGVTSKGLKSEDVVNNEVGKDCHTWYEFLVNGVFHRIDRYVKHHKHGDTVYLSKESSIYKKGHKEVVSEMDRLLLPFKLLMNTIFFGQRVKTFFTDLVDSEQKDIFRKVLLLDDYVLFYDESSKRLKVSKEELVKVENYISVCEQLIESGKNQIESFKLSKKEFYDKKKEQLEELNYLLSKAKTDVRDLNIENEDDKESELNNLKVKYESCKNKISRNIDLKNSKIEDLTNKFNLKISEFNKRLSDRKAELVKDKLEKYSSIEKESYSSLYGLSEEKSSVTANINTINSTIKNNELDIVKLERQVEDISVSLEKEEVICFACKQVVGLDNIQNLKVLLDEKNSLILGLRDINKTQELCKQGYQSLSKDVDDKIEKLNLETRKRKDLVQKTHDDTIDVLLQRYNNGIEEITSKYKDKKTEIENEFDNSNKSFLNDKLELENSISKLEEVVKNKKKIKELVDKLYKDIASYEALITKTNSSEFDETQMKITESEVQKRIKDLQNLTLKRKELIEEQEILEFWKEGFSMKGIPSMLIDEAIPTMNKLIKRYLESMGGRYMVSFDTLSANKSGEFKDKISVHVFDSKTKGNKRKGLSGGQVRLIDIATILTLSDLQSMVQDMRINIMLLDEIFDALDETNISYVSKLLRAVVKDRSIHVISHTNINNIECDGHFELH